MSLIRSEVVNAERALRERTKFAGRHVMVYTGDLVVLLAELDRVRRAQVEAEAAASSSLELSDPASDGSMRAARAMVAGRG
jgi:hypothetical protein